MVKKYGELYLGARKTLLPVEGENAAVYARELLSLASGKSVAALLADRELYASEAIEEKLNGYLARILAGEPLAYILGEWSFYGLSFKVTPDVLIPRDDTMAVTDLAIEAARACPAPQRVLDLCTGSGCIACSIAFENPKTRVLACDIAPEAISLAKENVASLGLEKRVAVLQGDLGAPVGERFMGKLALVVSNPPYIPTKVLDGMPTEVTEHEPELALDGGADGLDLYRPLATWTLRALAPGGGFAVELHETCLDAAAAIAGSLGFVDVRIVDDLAGRPRVLTARKPQIGA